jgi:hypothetical protein
MAYACAAGGRVNKDGVDDDSGGFSEQVGAYGSG